MHLIHIECKKIMHNNSSAHMKPLVRLAKANENNLLHGGKRRGAGRKKSDNPRSERIVIAVTAREKLEAERLAKREQLSISDWGRSVLSLASLASLR